MPPTRRLTAIIEREGDGYVALCPELDVTNQGDSLEAAHVHLIEALTWFFETADASEIEPRFHSDLFVTQVELGKMVCSCSKMSGLSLGFSQTGHSISCMKLGTMGIELLQEKRDEIQRIAARHGAYNLRVFGSIARGDARPDSDADFLISVGPKTTPWFPGGWWRIWSNSWVAA